MENEIISTQAVLDNLKREPDNEQQYVVCLGGLLRSTHWLEFNSKCHEVGDSVDWFHSSWTSEEVFLNRYKGCLWKREH